MGIQKFLVRGSIGAIIVIISIVILNFFVDYLTACLITTIGYIVYLSSKLILGRIHATKPNPAEILPPTENLPTSLIQYDLILSTLGFQQANTVTYKKYKGYLYWNEAKNIIVNCSEAPDAMVRFNTYLADGFDIMTDFPFGIKLDTKKASRHIVKSNLEAAFDYHQHHIQKYMLQHGEPKQFQTIQAVIDWEDKNNIRLASYISNIQFFGKVLIRLIGGSIVTVILWLFFMEVVAFGMKYSGYLVMPPYFVLALKILAFISLIFCAIWAFRPMYKSETVEDRKKKEFA